MKQIKVRWGDLGSPIQPGKYHHTSGMVEVTPGDIKLAMGNPDTMFTAIRPDFYSDQTPYLLTGVEIEVVSDTPNDAKAIGDGDPP
jgi:hypothetical protein